MNALREQMLKAGLVTEDQADKAKHDAKKKAAKQRNPSRPSHGPQGKRADARSSNKPRRKPAAKGGKPAEKVDGKIEHKAVTREVSKKDQVNKLIRENVVKQDGDATYYFPRRDGKLRSITVSETVRDALAAGEMAIIATQMTASPFAIVNKDVGLQIQTLQSHRVLALFDGAEEPSDWDLVEALDKAAADAKAAPETSSEQSAEKPTQG
jgi:uncharacterized protein YaiL (DUF2058 family)